MFPSTRSSAVRFSRNTRGCACAAMLTTAATGAASVVHNPSGDACARAVAGTARIEAINKAAPRLARGRDNERGFNMAPAFLWGERALMRKTDELHGKLSRRSTTLVEPSLAVITRSQPAHEIETITPGTPLAGSS